MKPRKIPLLALLLLLCAAVYGQEKNAQKRFDQAVKAAEALKDCRVRFRIYTSSGKNHEQHLFSAEEAKYLHHPLFYYQRRDQVESNYKEQGGVGFQEIYRSDTDLVELLLPGAFRALGLIRIFPEDPKGYGMNGGSLKSMAPWDAMEGFAEMAGIGKVEIKDGALNHKKCLLFEITQNQGTYYYSGINHAHLYLDPETLYLLRYEQYYPNTDRPMTWMEYDSFQPNTGLTRDQISFQGFKSPFSLITTPSAKEVDPLLQPILRTRLPDPAPDPQTILAGLSQAVDAVNSYRADLTVRFRYLRLRLYRQDRFAYNRKPYWFTLATTAQKADYILLNHSAGAVLWIDPKDNNIHIIGGGVQRILGEQVFSVDDYKFYSPLGDNPYQTDFAGIQNMIKTDFNNQKAEGWTVDYQGKKMWELKLVRTGETPKRHPGKINLVIDPETNLPAVVELSGYDDPFGRMAMEINNLKINQGLKPGQIKF